MVATLLRSGKGRLPSLSVVIAVLVLTLPRSSAGEQPTAVDFQNVVFPPGPSDALSCDRKVTWAVTARRWQPGPPKVQDWVRVTLQDGAVSVEKRWLDSKKNLEQFYDELIASGKFTLAEAVSELPLRSRTVMSANCPGLESLARRLEVATVPWKPESLGYPIHGTSVELWLDGGGVYWGRFSFTFHEGAHTPDIVRLIFERLGKSADECADSGQH